MSLTFWAVYTGDKYGPEYLSRLYASAHRAISRPFRFAAITDRPWALPGDTHWPDPDLPGWWQKLALFHLTRQQPPEHRNLYIDLDSIIVGELDGLLDTYEKSTIAMPKNWARSGHGGWQSSVMLWAGGAHPELRDDLTADHQAQLWGDQEWITQRLGPTVDEIAPGIVVSYKYHCMETGHPPASARVVTFHGSPKMAECTEPWIGEHWR